MSEPVLYVDMFGVIYSSLSGAQKEIIQPAPEPKDISQDINDGWQLLEQDAKISYLEQQLATTDLRKAREIKDLELCIKNYVSSIRSCQEENKRLQALVAVQSTAICKYQNDISSLLCGRGVSSHPGQVIDAQEKIISKLQTEVKQLRQEQTYREEIITEARKKISKLRTEVKEWKQGNQKWSDVYNKQCKVISELQSEVKKLEQRNHQWSAVSVVETEKISKLRSEIREWKDLAEARWKRIMELISAS